MAEIMEVMVDMEDQEAWVWEEVAWEEAEINHKKEIFSTKQEQIQGNLKIEDNLKPFQGKVIVQVDEIIIYFI